MSPSPSLVQGLPIEQHSGRISKTGTCDHQRNPPQLYLVRHRAVRDPKVNLQNWTSERQPRLLPRRPGLGQQQRPRKCRVSLLSLSLNHLISHLHLKIQLHALWFNAISPSPSVVIHCYDHSTPFISAPSPSSSRLTPSHLYSLRPRSSHLEVSETLSGLGIVPLGPRFLTTRGRKSYLNKAIRHAGTEVAAGRQATVDGVLRATKPPKIGPP